MNNGNTYKFNLKYFKKFLIFLYFLTIELKYYKNEFTLCKEILKVLAIE